MKYDIELIMKIKSKSKITKPIIEDYYDASDPRGMSTSEYNAYENALYEYNKITSTKKSKKSKK